MKTSLPAMSAFLCLPGLGFAQASETLRTATDVSVFAKSGNQTDLRGVRKDTPIARTLSLTASTQGAGASTVVEFGDDHGDHSGVHVHITETGSALGQNGSAGTSSSMNAGSVVQGPHSFLLAASATKGTRASLGIRWMSHHGMGGGSVAVEIDVNGDNKPDFKADQRDMMIHRDLTITAGDAGFRVLITTNGSTAGSSHMQQGYMGTVALTLDGPHCQLSDYARGCGPHMSGDLRWGDNAMHTLDLKMQNGPMNAPGLLVFGDRKIDIRLMGECWLRANPVILIPFVSDANGGAAHRFSFMHQDGMLVFMQYVMLQMGHGHMNLMTSNAMQMECGHGH